VLWKSDLCALSNEDDSGAERSSHSKGNIWMGRTGLVKTVDTDA
jgi:hypothetical protein